MKKNTLVFLMIAASLVLATACTSMSRGLGTITANKYAKARSGTVWLVPPPQLEPPAPEDKTCYISWRNISDSNLDMVQELRDAAEAGGWTIVNDPTEAKYRLRASCRFFGEVDPESGGRSVGAGMGWIAGAAVGIGTYALVNSATNNWAAGAVTGVAAGGLAAQGIANASKPREWALIIDFVLEEHSAEEIEFEMLASNATNAGTGAGTGNTRTNESGTTSVANERSGAMKQKSNYFPHGIRLSAWANQMNMSEEEALPLVESHAAKVITQMLPQ